MDAGLSVDPDDVPEDVVRAIMRTMARQSDPLGRDAAKLMGAVVMTVLARDATEAPSNGS